MYFPILTPDVSARAACNPLTTPEDVSIRHPGESRGPTGDSSPTLDTGFRRYDGDFLLHRAGAISGSFSVKEPMPKTTARLTLEGHAVKSLAGQALAGLMKPNLVSDLIQRGALR